MPSLIRSFYLILYELKYNALHPSHVAIGWSSRLATFEGLKASAIWANEMHHVCSELFVLFPIDRCFFGGRYWLVPQLFVEDIVPRPSAIPQGHGDKGHRCLGCWNWLANLKVRSAHRRWVFRWKKTWSFLIKGGTCIWSGLWWVCDVFFWWFWGLKLPRPAKGAGI